MEGRKKVGDIGEDLAVKCLASQGYKIIQRNFRLGHLEVDIIAEDVKKNELVFVEVKTRSQAPVEGEEPSISQSQIKKIKRAMLVYSQKFNCDLEKLRLDLIAVEIDNTIKRAKLSHLLDILG